MKVLMFGWEFPPFNSGGLGTACEGLTKGLCRMNVSLTFVLPKRVDLNVDFLKMVYGDDNEPIMKEFFINSPLQAYSTEVSYDVSVSKETGKKGVNYGKNLYEEVERYGAVAAQIAEKEDFDVIHAHDWLTSKAGIAAKKATGKPFVLHIHATEFDSGGGTGVNQHVYEIEKKGMEEADLVCAVSELTRQTIIKHYGISPEKVKVVHNAIDFDNYVAEELDNLKRNRKIVLFLGRLTIQKGPDYFVSAAKKVLDFYPDALFVVAGSGDMERSMIDQVAKMGLSDRFVFAGFLRGKDTVRAYQMADLYVMPSVSEPFGLTPLESLREGTPALISKQSGVSEILTNCLKADFWDVDDIANKIVSVLKHDSLHRCLKENGSEEVKKITWDKPAKRCVEVYEELINGESE